MSQGRHPRRRLAWSLIAALALHLAAAALFVWEAARMSRPVLHRVVLLAPPPRPATVEPLPAAPRTRPSAPVAQANANPEAPPEPTPLPSAPTVDLFPADVIARNAMPPDRDDPQARLDAWAQDFRDHQRAQQGDITPALRELGERMADWFQPPERALAKAAPFGLGVFSGLKPYTDYARTLGAIGRVTDRLIPGQEGLMDPQSTRNETHFVYCFGACDGRTSKVAEVVALIEIEHSDRGAPLRWRVFASSGDRDFDDEALAAVTAVTQFAALGEDRERPPYWSRWAFEAAAHRYSTVGLILDPLFKPEGREIESAGSILGQTMLTRRVRLVAVRYRE